MCRCEDGEDMASPPHTFYQTGCGHFLSSDYPDIDFFACFCGWGTLFNLPNLHQTGLGHFLQVFITTNPISSPCICIHTASYVVPCRVAPSFCFFKHEKCIALFSANYARCIASTAHWHTLAYYSTTVVPAVLWVESHLKTAVCRRPLSFPHFRWFWTIFQPVGISLLRTQQLAHTCTCTVHVS